MTDSRVLTREELTERLWTARVDLSQAILSHDAAQREEIDRLKCDRATYKTSFESVVLQRNACDKEIERLKERLREALDGWRESEDPAGAPGWSWNKDGQLFNETHDRIAAIRSEVFGDEGK